MARRPCPTPGCPQLTEGGYCPACKPKQAKADHARRGTSWQRGYKTRWQKLRKVILARDPICRLCHHAPSTEVDHIEPKPLEVDAADYEEDELQGVCEPCHKAKSAREMQAARRSA